MGRWFARAIDATATFVDVDPDAAAEAARTADGRVGELDGRGGYDVVCLAVPMTAVEAAIADHAGRAERAILDVSGVMEAPLSAMAAEAPDLERASVHPLFAPERAPGSVAVVRERRGPVTDAILADIDARGNDVVETTAAEHDDAMKTVQAAAHAAVLAFALAADPVREGFATPVYDDLIALAERVTGGTPRVYADIQETFDGADAVAAAAASIADADAEEFEALYSRAGSRLREESAGGDRR